MITIRLNERFCTLEKGHSLEDILEQEGFNSLYFAVALNKHFVRREQYKHTFLKEGDCVEVVAPMQGG